MNIIIDEEMECYTNKKGIEIGDWAIGSYYSDNGDLRYKEGIVTDVLEEDDE